MSAAESNAQKLKELEAKHGRVAHVEVNGKLYAFRIPTLDEWEDHQENIGKKRRGVLLRELAQICCVEPDLDGLKALFDVQPAINSRIGDAISELAGSDIEVTVKKG